MKKPVRILLLLIALVCFGIALYYPISEYVMQKQSVDTMDRLAALRNAGLEAATNATATPAVEQEPEPEPVETPENGADEAEAQPVEPAQTGQPSATEKAQNEAVATQAVTAATQAPGGEEAVATADTAVAAIDAPAPDATVEAGGAPATEKAAEEHTASADGAITRSPEPSADPTPSPTPTATPNRRVTTGAKIWDDVEKVAFDESKILPQYKELYAINNDMVGWLTIPGTKIDYPVMQTEDETYYLSHDFFHGDNVNGLLILDSHCDPYTPSYNLVVSGHNRWNNTIFSNLTGYYQDKRHRDAYKFIQFDSLMEERTYIVFAAFFAADYDVDEEGFRYNANIEYSIDASQWLKEIGDYKLYETDVDVAFGDEFLTLTTCNSSRRKNGRFVVAARRVRDGETFE